jgi:putative methionine-R-sulfoxide reductase with GAF domain/signal transduction histidine kinase
MRYGHYIFIALVVGATIISILALANHLQSPPSVTGTEVLIVLFTFILGLYAALLWSAVRFLDFRDYVEEGIFETRRTRRFWQQLVALVHPELPWLPVLGVITSFLLVLLTVSVTAVDFSSAIQILWPIDLLALTFASARLRTAPASVLVFAEIAFILAGWAMSQHNSDDLQFKIFPSLLWMLSLWGLNHYVLRKITWADTRASVVGEIARLISDRPEEAGKLFSYGEQHPSQFWLDLAQQASLILNFPRFTILAYDETQAKLYVRGAYSQEDIPLKELSWSVSEGITGWVTRNRRPLICPDVRWCPSIFKAVDGWFTLSEVAVPIIVNNKVKGVLDVQSHKPFYFDDGTRAALSTFAESFAAILAQVELIERETAHNYAMIRRINAELGNCDTLQEMLQAISQKACQFFNATNSIVFQLSPGLAWPILPSLRAGQFSHEQLLESDTTNHSVLHNLTERWEEVFASDSPNDARLQPTTSRRIDGNELLDTSSFVQRESISSTAFLPLGTKSRKIALLFINFQDARYFSNLDRLAYSAFADAATLALLFQQDADQGQRAREANRAVKHGPIQKALQNTRVLAMAAREELEARQRSAVLAKVITDLQNNLKVVDQNALDLLADIEADSLLSGIEEIDLESHLHDAAHRLRDDPPRWLRLNVDPAIDDDPPEVKAQLYSIAHEAIHNAIHHGEASNVQVRIERWPWKIKLVIRDNGCGFDRTDFERHHTDEMYKSWSPLGIEARLHIIKTIFGGHYRLRSRPKVGTIIWATIPARPAMRGDS